MKTSTNPEKIQDAIVKHNIALYFSTLPENMYLVSYQKGEDIFFRLKPDEQFLFLLEGTIRILDIHEDGSVSQLIESNHFAILGDMEFIMPDRQTLEVQAVTAVRFLAVPFDRKKMEKDPVLLYHIAYSIAEKLNLSAEAEMKPASLQERLLFYMKERWSGRLIGVEKAAMQLHCSRRQLQRILKEMTEKQMIMKESKGVYRLL